MNAKIASAVMGLLNSFFSKPKTASVCTQSLLFPILILGSFCSTNIKKSPFGEYNNFLRSSIPWLFNIIASSIVVLLYPFNYLFFCFATPMISMIIPITARIILTKNGLNENTVSPCQCNPNKLSFSPTIVNNGLRNKLSANNTIPQIILLFIDSKPLFQLR